MAYDDAEVFDPSQDDSIPDLSEPNPEVKEKTQETEAPEEADKKQPEPKKETETDKEKQEPEEQPLAEWGGRKVYAKDVPGLLAETIKHQSAAGQFKAQMEKMQREIEELKNRKPAETPKSEPKVEEDDLSELDGLAAITDLKGPEFKRLAKAIAKAGGMQSVSAEQIMSGVAQILDERDKKMEQKQQMQMQEQTRQEKIDSFNGWMSDYVSSITKSGITIPPDIDEAATRQANFALNGGGTKEEIIEAYQSYCERQMNTRGILTPRAAGTKKADEIRKANAIDSAQPDGGAGGSQEHSEVDGLRKMRKAFGTADSIEI